VNREGENATADAFAALVGQEIEDERIDLLRAALMIARTEYPDLDPQPYIDHVNGLAGRVASRVRDVGDPAQASPLSMACFLRRRCCAAIVKTTTIRAIHF